MSFDYREHINELIKTNPEKAIDSLERHESNLLNNPIDLHFAYNQMIDIYYKHRANELLLNKCIEICEKDINLAPKVINLMKDDPMFKHFNKNDELVFTPPRFPSFQRLAIIYDKQGKYEEAIKICENALANGLEDGTKGGFAGRIEKLKKKMNNPTTPKKVISKQTLMKHEELKSTTAEIVKSQSLEKKDNFMITFSKSTSNNFDRALFLAKKSDEFRVETHNNKDIYQAVYYPENYLDFIILYELIGNWKSTFVFKDGKMLDRKILGQINYCYGDKLRSNSDTFCYGASMFTENPFGCHRLMIHSGQRPWYEWKKGEDNKYIYIDKEAMKEQIDSKAMIYKTCPSFNYNEIIDTLNNLPNKIDKTSSYYKDLYTRFPDGTMTINVNVNQLNSKPDKTARRNNPNLKTSAQGIGCASLLITLPLFGILYFIL